MWPEQIPEYEPCVWQERAEPLATSAPPPNLGSDDGTYTTGGTGWDAWDNHYNNPETIPLYPAFTQDIWNVQPSDHKDHWKWARCPILIDSGASYAVVGKPWVNRMVNFGDQKRSKISIWRWRSMQESWGSDRSTENSWRVYEHWQRL